MRLDEEQAFLRAIERSESRSLQGQDVDVDGLVEAKMGWMWVILQLSSRWLEICREWGDTEEMIAKKREMMLANLITTESFYIPRTKPSSASPRLPSTSTATNSLLGNSSSQTSGEQEVVPTGGR